jgi:hypothetical protein
MTDQDFFSVIQYHLLEPADGGIEYQSELYTDDELVSRTNFRLRDFYKRTNVVTARDITISTVANQRDQDHPDDMIGVIRLAIEFDCDTE